MTIHIVKNFSISYVWNFDFIRLGIYIIDLKYFMEILIVLLDPSISVGHPSINDLYISY